MAVVLACLTAASAQSLPLVHAGTGGKETDAQVYYAQELGFFKRAGIDVEVQTLASGSAIAAAVAAGSLDVGSGSVLVVATARARGLPFVYIAPAGQYQSASPAEALGVALNSPIRSAKDLNGRTIGVLALRGIDQVIVQAWIDQNGGDSSSVHFVEVGPSEMPAALERGTIDAAQLSEPTLSFERGKIRVLAKSFDVLGKQFLLSGWFATADWVTKNPELAKKFAAAMEQAAQWATAHQAQATVILEKYSKIPADPGLKRGHVTYGRTLDPAALAPIIDVGVKYKVLPKAIPPADLIATGF